MVSLISSLVVRISWAVFWSWVWLCWICWAMFCMVVVSGISGVMGCVRGVEDFVEGRSECCLEVECLGCGVGEGDW